MAVKYQEAEVLRGGVQYLRPTKGSFALNMLRRYGAWEVRKGFGQLTQFDTSVLTPTAGAETEWGYTEHLGSKAIVTDFGHTQIVSVFSARINSSEHINFRNELCDVVVVSIYDVTTRERWEEPIYRHSSQAGTGPQTATNPFEVTDLEKRNAQYQTCREQDFQGWVGQLGKESLSFVQMADVLYFASPSLGVYAYRPASFRGSRSRGVEGWKSNTTVTPYGESSMVYPVRVSPGVLAGDENYRNENEIPPPQAMTSFNNRLVIAGFGREVFFSQRFRPFNFLEADFIVVDTEKDITAMMEMGQSLYIFTESETFIYNPSVGPNTLLASRGAEPIRISESVGCISQAAVTKRDSSVIWTSKTGVHLSASVGNIETISAPIEPLFKDFITDPSTSFFVDAGGSHGRVNINKTQRNSVLKPNLDGVTTTYCEDLSALFVTMPQENYTLCFTEGEWSVWSYDSNTGNRATSVQNITMPQLLSIDESLFLVGSVDSQALVDSVAAVNTTSRSAYILEYGRGGAIDRSIDDEDHRSVAGSFVLFADATSSTRISTLILGKWQRQEPKMLFAGGGQAPATPHHTYLVPVSFVPADAFTYAGASTRVKNVSITFTFDNTNWQPIYKSAGTAQIDIVLPAERLQSSGGWTAQCLSGGSASTTGNTISLVYDGTSDSLNTLGGREHLLLMLPMKRLTTSSVFGIGAAKSGSAAMIIVDDESSNRYNGESFVWRQWDLITDAQKEDSLAQPVDWAYMSEDLGLPEDTRVKARGLDIRMLTRGQGTDITGSWTNGLLNTLLAADLKTWMAQVIDYTGSVSAYKRPVSIKTNLLGLNDSGNPTTRSIENLRERIVDSNGNLLNATFSGGAKYGDTGSAYEASSCLIGDEQVDEIVTSDSVKGNSVSTMVFGFMRNPAEALKFESIKMLFRSVAQSRRRRGRGKTIDA